MEKMDKHEEAKNWIEEQGHYDSGLHIDEHSRVDLYLSDVLVDYHKHLESELKNHSDLFHVRLSSKAETIRVIRNRAEYFENRGSHKHAETECRCAVDIIERLVPPDDFQDES